jgi:hypothetical protein
MSPLTLTQRVRWVNYSDHIVFKSFISYTHWPLIWNHVTRNVEWGPGISSAILRWHQLRHWESGHGDRRLDQRNRGASDDRSYSSETVTVLRKSNPRSQKSEGLKYKNPGRCQILLFRIGADAFRFCSEISRISSSTIATRAIASPRNRNGIKLSIILIDRCQLSLNVSGVYAILQDEYLASKLMPINKISRSVLQKISIH